MLQLAIVEDDPQYADQLRDYVQRYATETGLELKLHIFRDGAEIIDHYRPIWDLIFLDIEMPLMDGMSAAETIRMQDQSVLLIFITNMAQYAIRGYEVDALDYVLKPISYPSFSMKFRKACRILESRQRGSVILSKDSEVIRLSAAEIRYIEAFGHRLVYHTSQGEFQSFSTLDKAAGELSDFVRCNRSYLVNLRYVDGVKDDCVLIDGVQLKIGRTKKKEFMQQLSDYFRYGGR